MKQITHSNGKKVNIQYFGNLQEKLDTCRGYVMMYNDMAAKKNAPQINVDVALEKIQKAHDRFYGNRSKYDGKGNLK